MCCSLVWTLLTVSAGFVLALWLSKRMLMEEDRLHEVAEMLRAVAMEVEGQEQSISKLEEAVRVWAKGRIPGSPLAAQVGEVPLDPRRVGWVDVPAPSEVKMKHPSPPPSAKNVALGQPS